MRNASGHECKVKISGSEKKVIEIPSIKRVTKTFLEVSRCSRAKQRQRNVPKKCAAGAKFFFFFFFFFWISDLEPSFRFFVFVFVFFVFVFYCE